MMVDANSDMAPEEIEQVTLTMFGPPTPEFQAYFDGREEIKSEVPVIPHMRLDGVTSNAGGVRGIFESRKFQAFEDDIVLSSFPKTGTTWAQEVVFSVAQGGDLTRCNKELLARRFPYLEFPEIGVEAVSNQPRPRFIKSHLHYSHLPRSVIDSKCKIIYISRNPKDTVVSIQHFYRFVRMMQYSGELLDMVKMFTKDEVIFSPFSTHVIEYWEKRNENNILFLWYEEMHKDLKGEIRRIAAFLDKTLTEEQIDAIAHHCSFQEMSQNPMTNYSHWDDMNFRRPKETKFFRKGKVGDWKEHFDSEMNKIMDDYVEEKFGGTDIKFIFE